MTAVSVECPDSVASCRWSRDRRGKVSGTASERLSSGHPRSQRYSHLNKSEAQACKLCPEKVTELAVTIMWL